MGRSVNKVIMIGNLGRDAEMTFTATGKAVTKFSIATSYRKKDASGNYTDETDWHNIVLWDAENLSQYLTKGKQVYVEGRLKTRMYEKDGEKKYSTEVVAFEVNLLGSRDGGGGGPVSQPRQGVDTRQRPQAQARPAQQEPLADDDVPF